MMKKIMLFVPEVFAPDISTRYPNGEKVSPIFPYYSSIERMNKDNVKEILKILIEIQACQGLFFRNVFRSNLKKLDRNEMNYLLILSDSLHNFSSYIKSCLMFLEGNDTSKKNWCFFATEVQRLKIVISDAENCNIKLNNTIRSWMFDLTRMNQYVDLLIEKLKEEGIE